MKIKTSELTGPALDYFVNVCLGGNWDSVDSFAAYHEDGDFNYSTNWAQGGPIIEREKIDTRYVESINEWHADTDSLCESGPTPLIAAMRCLVASKLGDEVEIPEELA